MSGQDGSICILVGTRDSATVEESYSFTVVGHGMSRTPQEVSDHIKVLKADCFNDQEAGIPAVYYFRTLHVLPHNCLLLLILLHDRYIYTVLAS